MFLPELVKFRKILKLFLIKPCCPDVRVSLKEESVDSLKKALGHFNFRQLSPVGREAETNIGVYLFDELD
jgi:hypothetical protein